MGLVWGVLPSQLHPAPLQSSAGLAQGGDQELAKAEKRGGGGFLDGAGAGAPLEAAVFWAQSVRGSGGGGRNTLRNTETDRWRS